MFFGQRPFSISVFKFKHHNNSAVTMTKISRLKLGFLGLAALFATGFSVRQPSPSCWQLNGLLRYYDFIDDDKKELEDNIVITHPGSGFFGQGDGRVDAFIVEFYKEGLPRPTMYFVHRIAEPSQVDFYLNYYPKLLRMSPFRPDQIYIPPMMEYELEQDTSRYCLTRE